MMRGFVIAAAIVTGVAGHASAQTTTGTTGRTPAPATTTKRAVTPAKPTSVRIAVRDEKGASLDGVHLSVSGATTGEYTTGAAGTAVVPNLAPGVYRVRVERQGFVTLEREFTLGAGAWNPIDVVLHEAPPPPKPEPPPPPPAAAMVPGGAPVSLSVPDFLEKNYVGRDALKESIVACKPLETVRLLQIRENIASHAHDRNDELIYVVAGEGAVKIGDEATAVRAGSLVVLPAGSGHAFERRGKNPLIVMSTLTGTACDPAKGTR